MKLPSPSINLIQSYFANHPCHFVSNCLGNRLTENHFLTTFNYKHEANQLAAMPTHLIDVGAFPKQIDYYSGFTHH